MFLTPNGGLVTEIPLFQGILGWWNIIWPLEIDYIIAGVFFGWIYMGLHHLSP